MTDSTLTAPSHRCALSGNRLIAVLLASLLAMMVIGAAGATSPRSEGLVAVAAQEAATPVSATPVAASGCEAIAPGTGAEPWVRTELYFGTTMPDGATITDGDWQAFLDEEITPRFPDGLTILEGYGQFLNSRGVIAAEDSIVLIIFYPADAVEESSASLEEIRESYETQFEQESVLRVDSAPVCVSF